MYADPSKIREHVVKVRFNDAEKALIQAYVSYTGEEMAPLLREMLLEQAKLVLFGDSHSQPNVVAFEVPKLARYGS